MRGRLLTKMKPQVSIKDYLETMIARRKLKRFFETWGTEPLPNPLTQAYEYRRWLTVSSLINGLLAELLEANDINDYRSFAARNVLYDRSVVAKVAISEHVTELHWTVGATNADYNETREHYSKLAQVGLFAAKSAHEQRTNEYIRQNFNDLHRGVLVINARLAGKR